MIDCITTIIVIIPCENFKDHLRSHPDSLQGFA